jgi:hypothetical protein
MCVRVPVEKIVGGVIGSLDKIHKVSRPTKTETGICTCKMTCSTVHQTWSSPMSSMARNPHMKTSSAILSARFALSHLSMGPGRLRILRQYCS